jgi:GTP-binding protein
VTQLLATRKGRMENMVNHGTGWIRLDYLVPARGLIGFRTEFMTETRGTGVLNHTFEDFEPWFGELRTREKGSLVADRKGPVTAYALIGLQERAQMLVAPTTVVYCGMIVGENSRSEDMDVNVCREKQLTPPREMSLEQALEFIADDECVEVTPINVRLRKTELDPTVRARRLKDMKSARKSEAEAKG